MIKIEMLKDIRRNCYEDILASLSRYWNREYQLCFLESWGFKYTYPSASIGAGLDPQKGKLEKTAKEYCGVIVEWNKFSISDIENIKNEILKGQPVCIRIDKYNCPWSNCYHEKRGQHHCLIVGINEFLEMFCADPFYDVCYEKLPKSDILEGCTDYAVFRIQKQYYITQNWRELVKKLIHTIDRENVFEEMRSFAKQIGKINDFKGEHKYVDDPWFYPLFVKIRVLANGRKLASQSIQYISQKYEVSQLSLIGNMLEKCGNLWLNIHSLLMKECYKETTHKKTFKIAEEKIIEISYMEEEILLNIKEVLGGREIELQDNEEVLDIIDVTNNPKINLSDYFNNKAFYKQGMEVANYMSKAGHFIYSDMNAFGANERVNKKYDNVQCSGQIIKVDNRSCKFLYILGFSDFSSALGTFEIIYETEDIQRIEVDLPNWIFPECKYDCIVKAGKAGRNFQGNNFELKQMANIYIKKIDIKEQTPIIAIKMPENKNMHIVDIYIR